MPKAFFYFFNISKFYLISHTCNENQSQTMVSDSCYMSNGLSPITHWVLSHAFPPSQAYVIILYRYNTTYFITNTTITAQEKETIYIPSQNLDYINVNNKTIHQETKTQ